MLVSFPEPKTVWSCSSSQQDISCQSEGIMFCDFFKKGKREPSAWSFPLCVAGPAPTMGMFIRQGQFDAMGCPGLALMSWVTNSSGVYAERTFHIHCSLSRGQAAGFGA